jgi:hypothetical protein
LGFLHFKVIRAILGSIEFRYAFHILRKENAIMTFTNKNKFFQYTVTLDTSNDIFRANLADNSGIYGYGNTIEDAVKHLENLV